MKFILKRLCCCTLRYMSMPSWRQRMREKDKEKYDEKKRYEALRAKEYRAGLNEDQKARSRELTRQRVARCRARKKSEKRTKSDPAVETRGQEQQKEKKRKIWAEEKRKYRAKLTAQKKRRILEKRRVDYEMKRIRKSENKLTVKIMKTPQGKSQIDVRSEGSKRKALSRARKALPQEASKYASTVSDLIQKTTPHKRHALEQVGLGNKRRKLEFEAFEAMRSTVKEMAHKRKEKDLKVKRSLAMSLGVLRSLRLTKATSKNLGLSWKLLTRKSIERKQRNDMLSDNIKQQVAQFYDEVSCIIPDYKKVSKKTQKPKRRLDLSTNKLYDAFKVDNPDITISKSTFQRLKPSHVQNMTQAKLRQCCCEYCTNIEHKLKVLNRCCKSKEVQCQIPDKYSLSATTLCKNNDDHPSKACIMRECEYCGPKSLENYLRPLEPYDQDDVQYLRWENIQTTKTTINGDVNVTKKVLKQKKTSLKEMLQELVEESEPFSGHLFTAKWQDLSLKTIRKDMPRNTIIQVMDFAENFSCTFQDEISAAHWHHEQATVHPTVCYYGCQQCGETVTESLVFISDDDKHDYNAVHTFATIGHTHLAQNRSLTISKYIQFTDGCASQYKSKFSFLDISYSVLDFNCVTQRNFFGSRHGKGPSDGESAVIKSCARNAVKSSKCIISNAEELYNYCSANLTRKPSEAEGECTHFVRTFFWVPRGDIQRNRDRHSHQVLTVKGTRKLHSVETVQPGIIRAKKLSCFCEVCQGAAEGDCHNSQYVDPWEAKTIKKNIVARPLADVVVEFPAGELHQEGAVIVDLGLRIVDDDENDDAGIYINNFTDYLYTGLLHDKKKEINSSLHSGFMG